MVAMKKGADALKGIHSKLQVTPTLYSSYIAVLIPQPSGEGRSDNGQHSRADGPYKRDFRRDLESGRDGQHGRRGALCFSSYTRGTRFLREKSTLMAGRAQSRARGAGAGRIGRQTRRSGSCTAAHSCIACWRCKRSRTSVACSQPNLT